MAEAAEEKTLNCEECGADLTEGGAIKYFETVTKRLETQYSSHLTEFGTLVTEEADAEDEVGDRGYPEATRAACAACDAEIEEPDDVEYAHGA